MILKDSDGFLLLVAAAPLVVLLGSGELSRSFRYHMTELELPSRFSLPQIFMARFVIAAVVDTLSLTCMLIMTAMKTYFTFAIWTCAELSGGIRLVVPAQQKPECEYTLLCDCLLCRPICVRSCFCKRPPGLVR